MQRRVEPQVGEEPGAQRGQYAIHEDLLDCQPTGAILQLEHGIDEYGSNTHQAMAKATLGNQRFMGICAFRSDL
jgi:hypothetical protein